MIKSNWKLIVIILIVIASFGIGYTIGISTAVNYCVDTAVHFLELEGINISIDDQRIMNFIWQ